MAIAAAAWNGPIAGGVPAARVPAGISPEACPNYPDCTNPNVAVQPDTPVQQYPASYNAPNPQYVPNNQQFNAPSYPNNRYNTAPQYNANPNYNQNALDSGEYTGDGDYRGEGLAESGAFGSYGKYSVVSSNLFKLIVKSTLIVKSLVQLIVQYILLREFRFSNFTDLCTSFMSL